MQAILDDVLFPVHQLDTVVVHLLARSFSSLVGKFTVAAALSGRDAQFRTRAQIIPLVAEQHLVAAGIARIVRIDEQTVWRWLKRHQAESAAYLSEAPHPGARPIVMPETRPN